MLDRIYKDFKGLDIFYADPVLPDNNAAQSAVKYDFVYVDEESFKKYQPKNFADLAASFREFKD